MLKRGLREKKSYLKDKAQQYREQKHADTSEKRKALQESLRTNTAIPHSIRGEAKDLLNEMIYNVNTDEEKHLPPRIVVTTSHNPSSLLKSFSKHISLIFNGQNMMRGKLSQEKISEYCIQNGVTHLIMLNEAKGNPTTLILCRYPHGPTYKFSLFRLKFQRRVKTFGEKPYLVIDGMDSEIGSSLKKDISLCFPTVVDGNRLLALINRSGTIAFRHFLVENKKLVKECEFDLRLFKVINSTLESEGEISYVLNAFTNTRKDDILKEETDCNTQ